MRKIHNDSSLDQQRKAYLSQNIMASKYIVAQQKRMHAITCSHGIRSYADAWQSVLGCSHYQRGCASSTSGVDSVIDNLSLHVSLACCSA